MKNYARIIDKDNSYLCEYDGFLFVLDTEGYRLYKLPFELRQVTDEGAFWDWFFNNDNIPYGQLIDYFILGADFPLCENDMSETKVKAICKCLLNSLKYREVV